MTDYHCQAIVLPLEREHQHLPSEKWIDWAFLNVKRTSNVNLQYAQLNDKKANVELDHQTP